MSLTIIPFSKASEDYKQDKENSFSFFNQLTKVIKQYLSSLKTSITKPVDQVSEDTYSSNTELLKSVDIIKHI
jgi:hypothetical protein